MSKLLETLHEIDRRYHELDHLLADPDVISDPAKLQEIGRERAELESVVAAYSTYRETEEAISDAETLIDDEDQELASLAEDELRELKQRRASLLNDIKVMLVPRDPNDEKNVIVEIR